MKTVTLNAPSTVYFHWAESDDRLRHDFLLIVDGWEVALSYAVVWLDDEALGKAIELEQLAPGDSTGWYVLDDCGDVCQELEPLEECGPLGRLVCQEISDKLHALSEIGEPPSKPLQEIYLEGELFQGLRRFRAEDSCHGVLINPVLPDAFDDTPNDDRLQGDIENWWGRPFIITHTLDMRLESYESYLSRARRGGWTPDMSAEEWADNQARVRQRWFERFPSGTAYTVRCLDGGAWDRSTWWGDADNLDAALEIAKTGPRWKHQGGLLK
ncbi:hypothetical protein [Billgrantia ethanolica]|uniref:Uncharacterized protein n=1 Tax=Billgrantia ethanolica TaxID=2733486 RepID=A0ABS9A908_9GAMM|nr:hypothetical protein [Halomonas ethanolica]MCE8005326.1 hypothetical protein [Halomonas ethanolica]